jgi:hypothetical protein
LIIASDKTNASKILNGQQVYPVYVTLGNISKDIRRKPTYHATVLLAYLPTENFKNETPIERRRLKRQALHDSMKFVTDPLKKASQEGVEMWCADGCLCRVYPMLAAFEGDWPEQCDMAGTMGSGCPMCHAKLKGRGDIRTQAPMRTKLEALKVLRMYKLTNDPGVLIEPGLRPYQPFWMDLPFAKLYTSIAPDLLHQIYTGMFEDHLLKWGTQLVGVTWMDARFKSMPRAEGIRHFSEGISGVTMWTGAECREMQKVLLPILVDTVDEGIVTAARAIIDFSYLAHMAAMTDSDLEELIGALQTFHRYKSALITTGIMSQKNFDDIPKLHMLSHYAFSIRQLGTPDGYSTESPEHLHIAFAKEPW